jgi:hypothetical protein
VYEYSFAGFRRVRRTGERYIEYVFSVTGGRGDPVSVTILLAEDRLAEWSGKGRELTASERYGVAKLSLKRALDRFPDPKSMQTRVIPDRTEVFEIAETLDL